MHSQWMGSTLRRASFAGVVFLFACTAVCWNTSRAWGQRRGLTQIPSAGILMPKPREVQVLLDEVQQNIESEEWSEASLGLGLLLGIEVNEQAELEGADYFMIDEEENDNVEGAKGSVFSAAMDLIASLPAEGFQRLELRYGVKANQLLEEAITNSDWEKIEQVAGKYSFTKAGQDACIIVGEYWLRKGEARRAARFLATAFEQKNASDRLGPALGVLTAAAYQSVGIEAKAFQVLESTRERFNRATVDWMGAKISWDGRTKVSKAILDEMRLMDFKQVKKPVEQPHYIGGNPNRNADSSAGMPHPYLRWTAQLHESKQHKANLQKTMSDTLAEGRMTSTEGKSTFIPSRTSIGVGKWVITSTYDQRIVAIDTQTGLLGWECFYSGMPLGFSMERFSGRDSHSLNQPAPDYLLRRVWGETVLGMISSDGERIFGISELPAIDVAESFALGQNARVAKSQGSRGYNVLQCWSVREEGKIKWEVGGAKSPSEPELAGCLFLGSPLPHDRKLFVMAELNSDVFLFVLDPATGKVLARQPLATNYSAISADQLRRNVGSTPAADGTVIVCPTLSGYLVAYDSVSQALLWAFQYPTRNGGESANQFGQFGQMEMGSFAPLTGRSADSSVVIVDGTILFAPTDGDGVYAVALETGKVLWHSHDSRLDQVRYVAGAANGVAYIACQSWFAAIDIKTGREKWPAVEFPNKDQLAGRGVRRENAYYLPTSGNEILQIDLEKGKVVETVKVDQALGNLTSLGDRLVSTSPFQIDCYQVRDAFQSQLKAEQLKAEFQGSSVSALNLAYQGELALAKGDLDTALQLFAKARTMEPNNAEIAIANNRAGIAALTSNFDRYVDQVSLSKELSFDDQRAPYLRLLIHGLQKNGRHQDALAKLLEFSDLRTSQRQDQVATVGNVNQTQSLTIQEDRWIATQIRRSYEQLTAQERESFSSQISAAMDEIRRLPIGIRRLRLEHLESLPASRKLQLDSAKEFLKFNELRRAEALLLAENSSGPSSGPSGQPSSGSKDEAIVRDELLAKLYWRVRRFDLALEYLGNDLERYNKLLNEPLETSLPSLAIDRQSEKKAPTSKPISDWPTGAISVTPQVNPRVADRLGTFETTTNCRWKSRIGIALRDWTVAHGQTTWSFANPATQEEFQMYIDVGNQDRSTAPVIHSVDSVVLIEFNRQIIAIDTLLAHRSEQDGLLWRKVFDAPAPEAGRGQSRPGIDRNSLGLPINKNSVKVAAVSRRGIVVLQDDKLECLEIDSGAVAWSLSGFAGCHFAQDGNVILVCHPSKKTIYQLDIRDGATLKELPLEDAGLSVAANIGNNWLLWSNLQKKNQLKLVNALNGNVMFQKEFPSDTKVGLDGESGVYMLDRSGELTYWNLTDGREYTNQVKVEGNFGFFNLQRFGDTVLILPNAASMDLDLIKVGPDKADPAFAPIAGQLVAVSAKDASSVWQQASRVQQMFFPLGQNRNTPIAIFVRRLELTKIGAENVDLLSVALVDVRDGRVLFAQDDLPAIRTRGFSQIVNPDSNEMVVEYQGTRLEIKWDPNGQTQGAPVFNFGQIASVKEFKKQVEEKRRQLQQTQKPGPAGGDANTDQ